MRKFRLIPIAYLVGLGIVAVLSSLTAMGGCSGVNPAAPPAPPTEVPLPAFLRIPSDVTISGPAAGSGAALVVSKSVALGTNIHNAIDIALGGISETNQFLKSGLAPLSAFDIPVDPAVTTFTQSFDDATHDTHFKIDFDFRPFSLEGAPTSETCSGCTCPVGCSPTLTACPAKAPVADVKPICVRVWVNDERYMAGVFPTIPTKDNAASGVMHFRLTFGDLRGSALGVIYDQTDPKNLSTDLSFFLSDFEGAGPTPDDVPVLFHRRTNSTQVGDAATAKKTLQFTTDSSIPDAPGLAQFQSQFLANEDSIFLEFVGTGIFGEGGLLGIPNLSPPVCASITDKITIEDANCTVDLGLALVSGDFVDLPTLANVELPPKDQFPDLPPPP